MFLKDFSFFKNFIKINFFIYILAISGDACSYLYQILNARFFDVYQYGEFNKFVQTSVFFTAPLASLQILVVKYISNKEFINNEIIGRINFYFLSAILIFSIYVISSSYFLYNYFDKNFLLTLFFVIWLYLLVFNQYILALYQGLRNYITFSFLGASNLFLKLFFLIVIYYSLYKEIANFLSLFISLLISSIITFYFFKKKVNEIFIIQKIKLKEFFLSLKKIEHSYIVSPFITIIYLSSDIFILGLITDNRNLGLFSSASIIGKILFFLCSISSMYLLPESSYNKDKSSNKLIYVRNYTFVLVSIVLVSAFIFIYFFKEHIVLLTFGVEYLYSSNFILPYCLAYGFLGINNNLFLYLIATDKRKFIFIPLFILITYLLYSIFFVEEPIIVIYTLILANVITFIFLVKKVLR